jgi:hypothetical protein
MIRFVCECGKQLQARDENAGKLVLCPACKRQLTVPDLPPPDSVQPDEPAARPSAEPRVQKSRPALRDEPEEEHEEEADDRPRRRPREATGSSGKAIASLVLGILSLCGCTCLAGLPSILLGILSLRDIGKAAGTLTGKPMAIIGLILGSLGTLCWPVPYYFIIAGATGSVKEAANKKESENNLKQMALAMHNYNDTNFGQLPPAAIGDPTQPEAQRKPNLSWRVAILPFIEQQNLYRQFKLNEPWDSPNNIKLLGQMPKVYKLPGDDKTKPDHTHYQVFVGNGAALEKTRSVRFPAEFPDGTSNTILIVEAAQAVPWTKPDDIPFDPNKPIKPLLNNSYSDVYLIALADGSTKLLKKSISENTLKAAITRNGGELLGLDW